MENPNYFTPEMKDLFDGYEFEYQIYNEELDEYTDKWEKTKFDVRDGLGHGLVHQFYEGTIRCEYLTKEQIESEGWKYEDVYRDGGTSIFTKGDWRLEFYATNKMTPSFKIGVSSNLHYSNEKTRDMGSFYGECKDINTFRYICKLLNI